jgi:hypothetical protein
MKIIVLFFISFIFLLTIILGYFLSKKIINRSELLIFWMLYLITISTVMTIFCSIYINYDIRNLKGPPGEQGDKGDEGEIGTDGLCESNCKDMIPYKSILNAIERRLYELEYINKDTFLLTNSNKNLYKELTKLKTLYGNIEKDKSSSNDIDKDEQMKQMKQMYSNIFKNELDESKIIKLDNPFFKETIKRIVQSAEYKQLEPIRGNIQLLDYVKFIFLTWVDLIYEQVKIKYFKTIGGENDLERLEINPYNEIKKYDIYYWGYSNSFKPTLNETKSLFASKKQLEPFTNLHDLRKPEKEIVIPNKPKELKILRTNDYMLSYNDKGSYLTESINCYRPKSVKHQGEIYYPLGDICVPEKHKSDKKIFGNLSSSVSKEKSVEKPNRDTILVAGDVKKPLGYNKEWIDLQEFRHDVHGDGLFGGGNNRYGYHRGRIYSLECPTGYEGIGIIGASTRNVPEEIKKHTDETGDNYYPKGEQVPVCLPKKCIEELDRDKFKEIWNTADSNKGYTKVFGVRKQVQYRTLFSKTDTTDFVAADHSNAYNLSDMRKNKSSKFYRIKDECISKEDALPYYNKKNNLWKTNKPNDKESAVIENFKNEIDLGGDDFQWPPLTKNDKTGEKDEDKFTMYISVKKDKETVLNAINDSDLKTFIKEYDNKFYEKNNYSNDEIIKLENKIDEIIMDIKKYSKKDLQIAIGFYDSISKNIKKYEYIKSKLENLYNTYKKIYGSKIQNEDDLGLGWNEIKQKELDNDIQSVHNLLYIGDRGILETNDGTHLLFNKVSTNTFTLQKNYILINLTYIYSDISGKIYHPESLSDQDLNNKKYHFRLILSNDDNSKGLKYYIKSLLNDKYIYYYENKFILSDKKSLFTLKTN